MKADITELLIIFDKLDEFATNEELGVYWFDKTRLDGLIVTLSFSIYECYVGVLVHNKSNVAIVDIPFVIEK